MQTEPQISFRKLEPTEELKRGILGRVEQLENFYEPIISCRVMVEVPHKRHETGNQYHVRIDTRVPGRELVESEDGREIYFHENDVREGDFSQLEKGTPVAFAEETGEEGPQASSVRPYPRSRP